MIVNTFELYRIYNLLDCNDEFSDYVEGLIRYCRSLENSGCSKNLREEIQKEVNRVIDYVGENFTYVEKEAEYCERCGQDVSKSIKAYIWNEDL